MVFLHHQIKKRPSSSFVPPLNPPKIPKQASTKPQQPPRSPSPPRRNDSGADDSDMVIDKMVAILAEAGCTLINPSGPPCLPSDTYKLRQHLNRLFTSSDRRSDFLAGFYSYINSSHNLRRVLAPSSDGGSGIVRRESLVRSLLLVRSIQLDIQILLLEKLPEYFDVNTEHLPTSVSLEDDIARLIIGQFRWLDFIVDPDAFVDKLMQVLCICPSHLKKEIIGSLPEIIGHQNNKTVVDFLEQMLQEDSAIVVPVLDSFSNLNLDDELQEKVITIALSCIRTIDDEQMPFLLRHLLLSATPLNSQRIITQIREQLKFVGTSKTFTNHSGKLKGKLAIDNTEASILDALRSGLLFKKMLCEAILKALNNIQKPQDHKVIDIWFIVLIYNNSESMRKTIEKIFKKKIIEGCIPEAMIGQCICGNKDLVQDYFTTFISLSGHLLACKEQKAREFGIYMYNLLFEECGDNYSRQEVLGALVTHVGSGVDFEVNSALESMALLASKYPQELLPLTPHINGLLDYLEAFSIESLHKVYEVFSKLAFLPLSGAEFSASPMANELLIVVRKQLSNPDLKYKEMGIIGTMKIISCLGDGNAVVSSSETFNCKESLELLRAALDACKLFCLPLVLLYDELATLLNNKKLQPSVINWIGQHVGEFESMFLTDLEGGKLSSSDPCNGIEGELWMNLDGDISPICLNLMPLASSSLHTTSSLQILPAKFVLLATVERLTNQGSLTGIDALLGCPLYLPASKYFNRAVWQLLSLKQKQIVCLSLYYAVNWIRELLNAFCSQVPKGDEPMSQTTEDVIAKLLKRLRNLIFLESLLNNCIKLHPLSLPELHFHMVQSGDSHMGKLNEQKKVRVDISPRKKKSRKLKASTMLETNKKLRQQTMLEVLTKAGVSQGVSYEDSCSPSSKSQSLDPEDGSQEVLEVSAASVALEFQRYKFRPLLLQCFTLLTFSKNHDSCCSDPEAELPLFLYLLRDLHQKLDYFTPIGKKSRPRCLTASAGHTKMHVQEFLSQIRQLFPYLRKIFDSAASILKHDGDLCEEHWSIRSVSAGNPSIPNLQLSRSSASAFVLKELLCCFRKMINLPNDQMDKSILSDLLGAFQPGKISGNILSSIQPTPSPGTMEYLYLGASLFIEDLLDTACSSSFMLATESVLSLQSIITSVQNFPDTVKRNGNDVQSSSAQSVFHIFCSRLTISAEKVLTSNWDDKNFDGWKYKGESLQKMLQIYLENHESELDLLVEVACSVLPQASSSETGADDDSNGFPTLCKATFLIWYRVLLEQSLAILNKLVKEVSHFMKPAASFQHEDIQDHLIKLQKSVNVIVSLVNMCRSQDKVTLHAMAVKFGGKFVDSFLKAFDFLEAQFQTHNASVLKLVKDLQKATRTIQTLCSEAKGLKQTVITSKIPATKRTMERFLFRVKALLHTTTSGCSFWMGNLKHKDLTGQVISSQAYVDEAGAVDEALPASSASEDGNRE